MDDLKIPVSTGKRVVAIGTIAAMIISGSGSVSLAKHAEDAQVKFIDQERRIVRLETKIEEIDARLSNIQTDVRDVLKELRERR